MTGNGVLRRSFSKYMTQHSKSMNKLPFELQDPLPTTHGATLYEEVDSTAVDIVTHFSKKTECLTDADYDCYNILLIGPSGTGKSSLINQYFNKKVCEVGPGAESKTKEVKFYEGRAETYRYDKETFAKMQIVKRVNIIDTIGKILMTYAFSALL